MAQKLTDLHPRELSLVRRGAVRRPFLFMKGDEDGEVDVDAAAIAELAKTYGIDLDEVAKAAAELPDDGADDETDDEAVCKSVLEVYKRDIPADELKSADASDFADPVNKSFPILQPGDVAAAAQALGRARPNTPAHRDEVKARIQSIAKRKGVAFVAQLPESWNVKKEDEMPEGTGTAIPIKKEDGTWDLSGVAEDARGAVEAVLKAHDEEVAELRKQAEADKTTADEALAIAKSEREQREASVFVAKAAGLDKLPTERDALAKDLHEISKAETAGNLPEGTSQRLEDLLKAANTAIDTGDLYRELGSGASLAKSGSAEFDSKVEEIRKADSSLTSHQAFAKAMKEHPDLYARATEETN